MSSQLHFPDFPNCAKRKRASRLAYGLFRSTNICLLSGVMHSRIDFMKFRL